MSDAPSGKTNPTIRSGIRTVLALLALLGLLYVIGFAGIYVWRKQIDIQAKLRSMLGITNEPPTTIVADANLPQKKKPKKKRKSRPRFLRDEPVMDNLPIIDEFTESIQAGRPILPQNDKSPMIAMPKSDPTQGISIDKPITPLTCWDNRGFEHQADKCDALYALNQLIKSKLHIFTACRDQVSEKTTGTLRFFMEADFLKNKTSFWMENSIGMADKQNILTCASTQLSAIPIENLPHRHSRYRLMAQIRFDGRSSGSKELSTGPAHTTSPSAAAELEKALQKAVEVMVTHERVRVRKSPIDGEIIGFISQPAKVKLIEKSDDWCLVKTKRGNVGWMVCWGLSADAPKESDPDAGVPDTPKDPNQN